MCARTRKFPLAVFPSTLFRQRSTLAHIVVRQIIITIQAKKVISSSFWLPLPLQLALLENCVAVEDNIFVFVLVFATFFFTNFEIFVRVHVQVWFFSYPYFSEWQPEGHLYPRREANCIVGHHIAQLVVNR
jgi:hypothetical protein